MKKDYSGCMKTIHVIAQLSNLAIPLIFLNIRKKMFSDLVTF